MESIGRFQKPKKRDEISNMIKELYSKYKGIIAYIFFGVCTTLVNVVVYWILAHLVHIDTMPSTIIAWFVAVLFAYLTNRKWVFNSQARNIKAVFKEILSFFSCRLVTGIIDWLCMFIFVDVAGWNDIIIKFLANLTVIILNYLASKFVIFKRTEK